ncbi:MAG TPA: glycosyltransferase family 4 protein [Xanthobacteraceae bacterium]|jgi:glycosyltransferase involved in cell wall biosynthesis
MRSRRAEAGPPRVTLVANIPVPYRIPVWNRLGADPRIDFSVVFCAEREPNRQWAIGPLGFRHFFLKERFFAIATRNDSQGLSQYIHNNLDVWRTLKRINPHVVMTQGFNPTFLYAFLYTQWHRRKHICMTDGTLASERALSWLHRRMRRIVFRRSGAFVGASDASVKLYRHYGLPPEKVFKAPLCVDNDQFRYGLTLKQFDLMFCGRLIGDKGPCFALEVAERAGLALNRPVTVLFVGSGPLEAQLREKAERCRSAECSFHGFAQPCELPRLYASARIFLFPTKGDVWGVVANEACAAGLPIVATPFAGSVGEIVQDDVNGFVRDFEIEQWTAAVCRLLTDRDTYSQFSSNSLRLIAHHNYDTAAGTIVEAALSTLRVPSGNSSEP